MAFGIKTRAVRWLELLDSRIGHIIARQGTLITLTKEILKHMATKEDADKLEKSLQGVKDAAELIAQDTAALKEELKKANENSSIDLTGAIAMAEGIEARLMGVAGSAIGSDPEDAGVTTGATPNP